MEGRYPGIAARIKAARLRKGWSQEHAAQQLGCSRLQWIRWEQGLHRPVDYATRLSELLGIPEEQLLEEEDEEGEDDLYYASLGRIVASLIRSVNPAAEKVAA